MTTALAQRQQQTGVAAFEKRASPLPSVLLKEVQVPGIRNPMWLPTVVDGAEKVQVEQALIELEHRLSPASTDAICAVLTALAEYYGLKAELGLTTKITMTAEDLVGFSVPHIEAAISEHRKASNWFPKSAELRERLVTRKTYALVMRHRARVSLGLDEPTSWEKSLAETYESSRAQREMVTTPPADLSDRVAKLPPALAGSVQRMIDAASKSPEPKQEAAE